MISDKFLSEAKIGADVELVIGPKAITGKIISLDTSSVKIQKTDGKISTVALDSIGFYEFSESDPVPVQPQKDAFSILYENGDRFFDKTVKPTVKSFTEIASPDRKELNSIAKSIDYAMKTGKETKITDFKIDDNIRKLKKKIKSGEGATNASNMLGALYYEFKNDRLALDAYLDGDDNESAFAVAENINSVNDMEKFACRHLINDKKLNPYILKWLLTKMIETDDYSIISRINTNETNSQKIQGYISFVKIALISKKINYDPDKSLSELIAVFKNANIGSKNKMSGYFPPQVPKAPQKISVYKKIVPESNYMKARKARDEQKNFEEAERLFLLAIHNGEKTSSAVADLISLMLQARDTKKAYKYLNEYKQYLDSKKYDNIRTEIFRANPDLRYETQATSNSTTSRSGFYEIAQRANVDEKDLQKSITYYKKAIAAKERLTSSIPDLVAIYTRLEMYEDALNLLNNEGIRNLEYEKYIKIRISVLSSAKDPKYKDDIIKTFDKAVEMSNTGAEKAKNLLSEAGLMNIIGEYETAVELFEDYKRKEKYYLNSDVEKAKKQKIFALTGMCNAYSKLGNNERAIELANEILELDPEHEFAKSVVSGEINENTAIIDDSDIDFEDMTGISQIPKHIAQRIKDLSLENELKNKALIKGNEFIGTASEASAIINSILTEQVKVSINDENQSNNYFTVAKIISQMVKKGESSKMFNDKKYLIDVAIGSYFYGNYRLFQTEIKRYFDTSRYYFFAAISMFKDTSKINRCWAASTVRYIETFFCSTETIKNGAKIYYTFRNYDEEYKDEISKIMNTDIVAPLDEFVSGMIEMLTYNSRVKNLVLKKIFANPMQTQILDILGKIADIPISHDITEETFFDIWENAREKYYPKREAFLRIIEETIESVFTIGQLQENYNRFINCEFRSYLNQTDREYIEELGRIFSALLKYNEASEFDYKAETLGNADMIRKVLEERISKNPTYIGHEKLLPMLQNQLTAKIFKESAQLYGNSHPDINVELSGDCSIDEENLIVRAPVAFINKNNVQNADNVSIEIKGENITVIDDEQLSKGLLRGNGKPREEMLKIKVTPEIIKSQVFTVNIRVKYQYKNSMTEFEEGNKDFTLSVPLYSSSTFEPIYNKFLPYRNGSTVKEASMFFGRNKDIEKIIEQISDKSGNVLKGKCLALYGQTRTGKSSLLYHLECRLREINQEANVIINVGSIGEENLSGNDIKEFLYTVLLELKNEIKNKHPVLNDILLKNEIEIDPDKILDSPEHSQLYFNEVFRNINRCLEDDKYNFIVMIDEFTYVYDWIRSGKMTDRFTKFWKAFIQNSGVFGVIIGQDHMMKFVNDTRFTNDLGATDMIKVTYLPEEDAKKLMYEPIMLINENGEKINRYQEEALNRLYELTAGSAFLIMILCSGLVEYLNATKSVYITRAHIDEYIRENLTLFEETRFFEPLYDDKSNVDNKETIEENKRILHKIAKLSNKREWASLSSIIKSENDEKLIEELEQRDVLIVQNHERCKIKVALYKEWIIAKYGVEVNN